MFHIQGHLVQKEGGLLLPTGLMQGFHVIFPVIWFFNTDEDVAKNYCSRKFRKFLAKLQASNL